jgi:hypothetical protein
MSPLEWQSHSSRGLLKHKMSFLVARLRTTSRNLLKKQPVLPRYFKVPVIPPRRFAEVKGSPCSRHHAAKSPRHSSLRACAQRQGISQKTPSSLDILKSPSSLRGVSPRSRDPLVQGALCQHPEDAWTNSLPAIRGMTYTLGTVTPRMVKPFVKGSP